MIRKLWNIITGRRSQMVFLIGLVSGVVLIWWCNEQVVSGTRELVFDNAEEVPYNMVGVVLGTSAYQVGGGANPYFTNRIKAAAALYRSGKVAHLIVSGDNRVLNYNEPIAMRKALVAAGVDSAHITLDYAGFRTFDSVVRAKEVFGQTAYTIISQKFHNERAVFLARRLGITAVGYNAKDLSARNGWKTQFREKLARVKVFFDLFFDVDPKFLGDPILIS